MRDWQTRRKAKHERMTSAAPMMDGGLVRPNPFVSPFCR
jgi:hypothetical protein